MIIYSIIKGIVKFILWLVCFITAVMFTTLYSLCGMLLSIWCVIAGFIVLIDVFGHFFMSRGDAYFYLAIVFVTLVLGVGCKLGVVVADAADSLAERLNS